ncbi:MAG: AAA family ATPase, partial [Pseudomonadaceae bacterium]
MYAVSDSDAYPSERETVQRLAPQPRTIAETGLSDQLLVDLLCKHLHEGGALDMARLVDRLALPGTVLEEVLGLLRKDGRIEVLGQHNGQALRYSLTERGRNAARDALDRGGYIGAAPFPVSTYRSLVKLQTVHHARIDAE